MILDRFRMDDKVAIVTGAGRGIGAAAAIALAQAGADVVISARTTEQLDQVVAQVEAAGRRAVSVPANLNGSGYPANVRAWANRDGCNPHSTETMRAPHIIERTYRCPPGVGVVFYIVLDGGHAWPGSKFTQSIANITGFTTFEINATDTIWKFFGDFQLPRAMAKSARH